jgi:hypothetical protein
MAESAGISAARLADFDHKFRISLAGWLESPEGRSFAYDEQLRYLPDLFSAVARLLMEDRVPPAERPLLVGALI